MKDNSKLHTIFGDHTRYIAQWRGDDGASFKYSHYAILDKINPETDHVIDVGCGANMFYGKIKNLVSIDPVPCSSPECNPYILSSLEDFETDQKFDVAMCLGSIQFGTYAEISSQIEKVVSLLRVNAKIFWRFRLEDNSDNSDNLRFKWNLAKLQEFADTYGFVQQNEQLDTQPCGGRRQYVEWVREDPHADE